MEDKKESSATTMTSTTTMKDKMSDTAMMKGTYEDYSSEKVARAETGDVVLFFHASWCPSCRGLGSDIETNMASIPEGVSILKVDYDKEVELKKKYGVTYQHTLVQVDKDGNLIKKWSGSSKLSSLLSEIQ
jgi:thioredoxin-like negative regulator of GroEL